MTVRLVELEAQLSNMPTKLNRLLKKLNDLKLQPHPERPVHKRASKPIQNAERRLGAAAIQQLITDYEAGTPSADLMTEYAIGKATVIAILRRQGIKIRNQGLADEQIQTATQLYEQGWLLKRVGERFGCNAETVRKRLAVHGVTIRRRNGY